MAWLKDLDNPNYFPFSNSAPISVINSKDDYLFVGQTSGSVQVLKLHRDEEAQSSQQLSIITEIEGECNLKICFKTLIITYSSFFRSGGSNCSGKIARFFMDNWRGL